MIPDGRQLFIKHVFDGLFDLWAHLKGTREGSIHASSILQPEGEFCYREHVLGASYRHEESVHSTHTLAVFLHGWMLHEKWQFLFAEDAPEEELLKWYERFKLAERTLREAGNQGESLQELLHEELVTKKKWRHLFDLKHMADEVEHSHYMEIWGLSFTPDAIIRLTHKNSPEVVEIKGYNDATYKKIVALEDKMENSEFRKAAVQANLYMHMLQYKRAIILIENKNTQEYLTEEREYDEEMVAPYIERLERLKKLISLHKRTEKLPMRICQSIADSRAQKCPVRSVCFAKKNERNVFLRERKSA